MKNASGIAISERTAPDTNAAWMPSAVAPMTLAPSSIRRVDCGHHRDKHRDADRAGELLYGADRGLPWE